jgi:hypothetical protein
LISEKGKKKPTTLLNFDGYMFFDDEEMTHSIFGGREEMNSACNSQQIPDELSRRNFAVASSSHGITLSTIDQLKMKHKPNTTKEEPYSHTYCSDTAIHTVLESTSMSYQYPVRINRNECQPTGIQVNLKPHISPLDHTRRGQSTQAQWEISNSVYCTHHGLDTILSTSSLAYSEPNPQNNPPLIPPAQQDNSYDDDDYLLAFGRAVNTFQEDKSDEESFFSHISPQCNDGHTFFDLPDNSTMYLEGMDDFDVFSLFPPSDDQI